MNKPKVVFKFDKEGDLRIIWETCNKNSMGFGFDFKKKLDPKTIKICEGKKFEECKNELAKRFEKMHSSELIPIFLKSISDSWAKINDEYFKRLKSIMKKPIYTTKFTGYLSFGVRFPYHDKEDWFMFGFFNSIPGILETCGHEIMHLQFHHTYWSEIEKQIGNKKTDDLKEALTVFLNLEFKDLWFVEDRGYDIHKELREFIAKEWKKEKDFDVLLQKCVKYLK